MLYKLLENQGEMHKNIESHPEQFEAFLKTVNEYYGNNKEEKGEFMNSVINNTERIKELERLLEKATEETASRHTHLEATQRIAHIGSWEIPLHSLEDLYVNPMYWSEETFRIFGFEPHSITVTNELFFSRVHPGDHQMIKDGDKKAVEKGEVSDIEYRLVLPGNIEKTVYERKEVIYDTITGKPVKMFGTIQDITERRKAREKLIKANTELKLIFENMNEVFFSINMETNQLLQMSKACERVYGYTVKEFAQNSNLWHEVVLDADKEIINVNYHVMNEGKPFTQEYRIRHKNGCIRWLESRITPSLNEQGKLVMLYGVTADITQRKEAETALKNNERKFRSLIENSSDGIIVINEANEMTYASDSTYKLSGYLAEEMIGRGTLDLVHPDDQAALTELYEKVLKNPGEKFTMIYRLFKKDGSYIWCHGTAINLLLDPVVKGIVINFRDITEQKAYEEVLKDSNEELQKSNNELDRFVYSASHDLRAPLVSMLGVIGLAETETTDLVMHEYLSMMKSSIHKLDNFISDILNYSKNSRLELRIEEVNFKELLAEITNNLKHMKAGDKTVDMRINIPETIQFHSDKSRISVILSNLISNAIRYYDPNAAAPFVEITVNPSGKNVEVKVRDNGIGIGKDKHEKVFNMFYRISKTSTGSGLGLYIVKEAIEKLGGDIHLESDTGKGTEFTILLPDMPAVGNQA